MDQRFIDNSNYNEIKKLKEEVEILHQKIHHLQGKIYNIQHHCKHIFLESSGMRKCQKCGFGESTYY
jgi:hypothetical protein